VKALGIKQVKIEANEVTIGMFISGLDRPWTQTPFPLQGFFVRNAEEIKELARHCRHVYIDVAKGSAPVKTELKTLKPKDTPVKKDIRSTANTKLSGVAAPIKVRHNVYPAAITPVGKEIKHARELHQDVFGAVARVMESIEQGQSVPLKDTQRAASSMVDSILRCPDAFTWLSRVRDKDEHTYSHAMRSAVWGILFGRHIGLSKSDLDILAIGVLLKDIGKTRIPHELLGKENQSPEERVAYEKFVDYGVDILGQMPDIQPRVVAVVKTHCERVNGSGFPAHLRGDRIPLLGKVAGIVTFYDEVTNPRGKDPLSPSKAVAKLYDLRDIAFQKDLVVEFIRAIGLYPTGTLVELNTGEVAVVVEQNFSRRLKPKVMIVMDAYKQRLSSPVLLDMEQDDVAKQAKIDAGKLSLSEAGRIEIVQDLEAWAYDVNVAEIRDLYLEQNKTSKLFSFLKGPSKLSTLLGG
jgi:HD-GYP domain-containing protein (c-di-GMP phosphodiesterase class II)